MRRGTRPSVPMQADQGARVEGPQPASEKAEDAAADSKAGEEAEEAFHGPRFALAFPSAGRPTKNWRVGRANCLACLRQTTWSTLFRKPCLRKTERVPRECIG